MVEMQRELPAPLRNAASLRQLIMRPIHPMHARTQSREHRYESVHRTAQLRTHGGGGGELSPCARSVRANAIEPGSDAARVRTSVSLVSIAGAAVFVGHFAAEYGPDSFFWNRAGSRLRIRLNPSRCRPEQSRRTTCTLVVPVPLCSQRYTLSQREASQPPLKLSSKVPGHASIISLGSGYVPIRLSGSRSGQPRSAGHQRGVCQ
jgi:hypothetical protein